MVALEEIVKQADLLGYRGEKREEYLKQEFKLLAERQEKKEKEEAERQAREKMEEAERKERLELEKMKLDAEMKLLQAKIEAGIIKNESDGSGARSSDAWAKHLKLPSFQDGRDDLDIWLARWIELSKTDKSYEKLKDLIVREHFMDACPEDLATSLREKDLPTLERVAKEADLFLQARNRKLCDQPRKGFQGNVRPRMDSVQPLKPEKKFNGGQRAGEAKTGVADQRSSFKCKKTGHIARYCTAVDSTTKKDDNTALLAEKAVISLRTPFLSGEVKALCIPDAICDVIIGKVEGARSPENPDMSMVVSAATTRAQAKREVVTKPRTNDKVLSNFYWPGVDGVVTRYCRSCDVCQRTVKKGTVPRVLLEKVPLIDTPFKRVAIDLVGPINPPSEAGHRFILTLVDYATRFAEAVPLRKIDTESVAEALVDINSRLGVPEEVLSDQGTQFISDCMKEVCRNHNPVPPDVQRTGGEVQRDPEDLPSSPM
ncbi:gypsy retrotransposon integrase-like protein 1 [Plakobranchus ocellatus]|uniref:Gypsy retrotransposon integrase-like protein 1 n=1 Tax=Plakobranchus ocellatus TaxID=259542 RepID=A0AAV3ZCL9_9GAST|nr:gypsy retrotransposon integrase-like protein 1 [Plakobranchus ocellatus]